MPKIVPDQPKPPTRRKFWVHLEETTIAWIEAYAQFRQCSASHVIAHATMHAIKKDEEFTAQRPEVLSKESAPATPKETTKGEAKDTRAASAKEPLKEMATSTPGADLKLSAKPDGARLPETPKPAAVKMAEPVGAK